MYDPASALMGKTAVFAAMAENPAVKALAELATDAKFDRNELTITVARESIVAACEAVKAAGYNFFEDLTAVDWYPQEPRFQLSYHIVSHSLKQRLRLRVLVDSADASVRFHHLGVAFGKLLRARGLRPLRHRLPRPSPPDAHHDARGLGGPSSAQGLSRWKATGKTGTRFEVQGSRFEAKAYNLWHPSLHQT